MLHARAQDEIGEYELDRSQLLVGISVISTSSPQPKFAAVIVSRENRYAVQLRNKSGTTLNDFALQAQRMVAQKELARFKRR